MIDPLFVGGEQKCCSWRMVKQFIHIGNSYAIALFSLSLPFANFDLYQNLLMDGFDSSRSAVVNGATRDSGVRPCLKMSCALLIDAMNKADMEAAIKHIL